MSLREICAVPRQHSVVALGQPGYKAVRTRKSRRRLTLFVGGVQSAVSDIVHNRAGKQVCILQDNAERAAQVCFFNLVYIDAVIAYFAVGDIVKAVYQIGYSGLARTRRADKSHLFACVRVYVYIPQNGFAFLIAELHVVEQDIAVKPGIGERAVAVRMFPSPNIRASVRLGYIAVLVDFGVHQSDVAFVRFALFVQKREHARRTGLRERNEVDFLRNHCHLHTERASHIQKRRNDAHFQQIDSRHCYVGRLRDDEYRTQERHEDVHNIADVSHNGHHNVRIAVSLRRIAEQFIVLFVEALFGFFLVTEYLDDFLPLQHFFYIAFQFADGLLLQTEMFT